MKMLLWTAIAVPFFACPLQTSAAMFYAGNQHYYDFVSFEDTGWAAAKVAAESVSVDNR